MTVEKIKEKEAVFKKTALVGEVLGTFMLAGTVLKLASEGTIGALGIVMTLTILVIIFGVISGAHLNPAITVAQYINRKISGKEAISYIIAQIFGALLAFAVLYALFHKTFVDVNIVKGSEWTTFWCEVLGAVVFGLGLGHAVFQEGKSAVETGLVVGFSLLSGLMIGGATVVLNPAIAFAVGAFEWGSFGSMIFWAPIFTYIFGTTLGMTIGLTAYRFILKPNLTN